MVEPLSLSVAEEPQYSAVLEVVLLVFAWYKFFDQNNIFPRVCSVYNIAEFSTTPGENAKIVINLFHQSRRLSYSIAIWNELGYVADSHQVSNVIYHL